DGGEHGAPATAAQTALTRQAGAGHGEGGEGGAAESGPSQSRPREARRRRGRCEAAVPGDRGGEGGGGRDEGERREQPHGRWGENGGDGDADTECEPRSGAAADDERQRQKWNRGGGGRAGGRLRRAGHDSDREQDVDRREDAHGIRI